MLENTVCVSVTGIDGSGKTSVVELVSQKLAKNNRVGVLSSSKNIPYVLTDGKSYSLFPEKFKAVNELYRQGQESKNTLLILFSFVNFLLLREKVARRHMITNYQPDYIVCDRDSMVDSHVLLNSYFENSVSVKPLTYLIEMLIGANRTDELFLLTIDPKIALQRLQNDRSTDVHESVRGLQRMAQMYPGVILSMTELGKVGRWLKVDTELHTQQQVSEIIVSALSHKT